MCSRCWRNQRYRTSKSMVVETTQRLRDAVLFLPSSVVDLLRLVANSGNSMVGVFLLDDAG